MSANRLEGPPRWSRRSLIRKAAVAGMGLSATGCERLISRITWQLGEQIPDAVSVHHGAAIDPMFHLLSRTSYGLRPGDLDRARTMGKRAWLEEQLHPDRIDDSLCDLRARRFETLHLQPGDCYEFKKPVLREEITRHTLLRAVYSRRQLFEVTVGFWTDHLNINLDKGDCIYLKPADDRLVVRAHALGRFRDLIRASAASPAMLEYLDGNRNRRRRPEDIPNENYARELLELHTLGVDGGYTQRDVFETARCLTGWKMRKPWRRASVYFDPGEHDDGEKEVLGQRIAAGGGPSDLDRVVEIVCGHPSTARHIAAKLARRFVSDAPPASLVESAARVFQKSGGNIRSTLRAILLSREFEESRGLKIKRPFHFVAGCLRVTGADTHARRPLLQWLERMGQPPFQHPSPDGYPDEAAPWLGTLLWRWNFALSLAHSRFGARVPLADLVRSIGGMEFSEPAADRLLAYFLGRAGTPQEVQALKALAGAVEREHRSAALVGLILASPAFQRY